MLRSSSRTVSPCSGVSAWARSRVKRALSLAVPRLHVRSSATIRSLNQIASSAQAGTPETEEGVLRIRAAKALRARVCLAYRRTVLSSFEARITMLQAQILLPMFALVGLTFGVLLMIPIARFRAVAAG